MERKATDPRDISPLFRPNAVDARHLSELIKLKKGPPAVAYLERVAPELTDYAFWYALGTLWVDYSGWTPLATWKRLFATERPNREACLMKPSELRALRALPESLPVFRAHRPSEEDWIAYTLSPQVAARFAVQRGVAKVTAYRLPRSAVLALFLRREEAEILSLDKCNAERLADIEVVVEVRR